MTETILRDVKIGEQFMIVLWDENKGEVCLGALKTGILRWSKMDDLTQEYTLDK